MPDLLAVSLHVLSKSNPLNETAVGRQSNACCAHQPEQGWKGSKYSSISFQYDLTWSRLCLQNTAEIETK